METPPPATTAPSAPAEVPRAVHSLTLSSGAVFAASLAVQLIGLVGSIFLAKRIGINTEGQALIGTAQLFLLIGSSINGVGDLRLGTAYTYYLARGKPVTDNTSTYLIVRMLMVGAAGLVLFVIAPVSVFGTAPFAQGSGELTSLGIFLALPLLWSFSTVYNQMYIGLGNSLKAQYPSLVEAIVRLPFLIYIAYYLHSVLAITIAYAIGAVASTIFCLPAVLPRLKAVRWSEAYRLFRFAWPLMGSLMLNYFVTNMIPLIISAAPGLGRAALSIFLAANGWRILVLSLPAAVTTPLFPYLAGLHKREEYEEIRRGTWQALRYSAMLLVPGVVALVTYRYNFLNVFQNKAYAGPGALPLAILVVGALPLALSQIIQSSINAIGRQRLELYITSTQVAVLFVAVLLLMPPWGIFPIYPGIVAGAVAVLISSVAALALNTYFMETLIRVHIRPWPIAAITVSAAGSFTVLWLLNHVRPFPIGRSASAYSLLWLMMHLSFPVSTWYELLIAVLAGFAAYFVILAAIGELTQNDIRLIGRSIGLPWGLYEALSGVPWRVSAPDLTPIDLALAPGLRATELPETFTGTRELPDIGQVPPEPSAEPPKEGSS